MPPRDPEPDFYTPESVRYYVLHWRELVEMAQGCSNGLNGRSTGGHGRSTFAILISDLEQAADSLPTYWLSTAYIFSRQRRVLTRIPTSDQDRQYESPIPSQALEDACYRMALSLGYSPIAQSAA